MVVLAIDVIPLVRIFGTEDRKCEVFIGVVVDMKPIISFNRSGIQTISLIPQVLAPFTIHSQYSFFDPSIADDSGVSLVDCHLLVFMGRVLILLVLVLRMVLYIMHKWDRSQNGDLKQRPRNRDFYHGVSFICYFHSQDYYRNASSNFSDAPEEPISNDFDFEESNKKLEKDSEPLESSSPAYKKDDFFDSLQEKSEERELILGRHYRGRDEETFGKRSLDERNRENRNNFRYRIFGLFFQFQKTGRMDRIEIVSREGRIGDVATTSISKTCQIAVLGMMLFLNEMRFQKMA